MTSLTDLKRIYERSLAYMDYVGRNGAQATREHYSEFWSAILRDRPGYPSFNDMLLMRRGATFPLADRQVLTPKQYEEERSHAEAAYYVVSQSMPAEDLLEFEESAVGSPVCFDFQDGNVFSAGGVTNALTAYRIQQWCNSRGLATKPLRVLEIGAGYGQVACQLLKKLNITSYTVVDLPENLFLSSFYLQANFPARAATFVGENVDDTPTGMVFTVPQYLDRLEGTYDLVVNSYSFQEMSLQSVQEYFSFVQSHMAANGIFYSLNAHRKDGVVWPSDYPTERFVLTGLAPVRKYPFQAFATVPYEIVMTRRKQEPSPEQGLRRKRYLDAIGSTMQLGLHDELIDVCDRFTQDALTGEEEALLDQWHDFWKVSDYDTKCASLQKAKPPASLAAAHRYILGCLDFASGKADTARTYLDLATTELGNSHALVRTLLLLSALADTRGEHGTHEQLLNSAIQRAPHLGDEMKRVSKQYESLRATMAVQVYLEQPKTGTILTRLLKPLAGIPR